MIPVEMAGSERQLTEEDFRRIIREEFEAIKKELMG